jgi:serine/threonine protein kinase
MSERKISNSRFGSYILHEKIGTGSLAIVYKAINESTGKTAALKIFRAELSQQPDAIERLTQTVQAAGRLRHPHILPILNAGMAHGRFYIEMPYMPRGTLAARFKQPAEIGPQETIRLIRHIGGALDYLHRQNTYYGDLKLENVLLDERGDPFIADWGIRRAVAGSKPGLSGSGPYFLAPEQAQSKPEVTARTDLYALAVMGYALLVGHFPFMGEKPADILKRAATEMPPKPSQITRDLPAALDSVMLKGLAKNPAERYPSADILVEAVARALVNYAHQPTQVDLWSSTSMPTVVVKQEATTQPASVDSWVTLAGATSDRDEAIAALKKALAIEPLHSKANRMLFQLEGAKPTARPDRDPSKPSLLIEPDEVERPRKPPVKSGKRGRSYLGLISFLLLSLTSTFFVLSFLGSPIAGQITAVLKGQRPVNDIQGTPIQNIPDAVLKIQPSQSKELIKGDKPSTDTLDAGISHQYTINVSAGHELLVYIQFASPNAHRVAPNVAVLKPDGSNATPSCQADKITSSGADVTLICPVAQSGQWKVRLLGKTGESTGVYFISVTQD